MSMAIAAAGNAPFPTLGQVFAFSLSAGAVEFDPIPKVTSNQQCVEGGLLVSILMTNEGAGTATFFADWNDTLDGLSLIHI